MGFLGSRFPLRSDGVLQVRPRKCAGHGAYYELTGAVRGVSGLGFRVFVGLGGLGFGCFGFRA